MQQARCGFFVWSRFLQCRASASFDLQPSLEQTLGSAAAAATPGTIASLLRQCGNSRALEDGKRLHQHMIATGHARNSFLCNLLVQMYGKCGSLEDARLVFDSIPQRNLFSWTLMISAYAHKGHPAEALDLFQQMETEGIRPDCFVIGGVLGACTALGDLETGRRIHARIVSGIWEADLIVETALLNMYAKAGSVDEARQIFDRIAQKDVISWNAMLAAYAQKGHCREAIALYHQMHFQGVLPDEFTFSTILGACASLRDLQQGRAVHGSILSCTNLHQDEAISCNLIKMYAKCGDLGSAQRAFSEIQQRGSVNLVAWTSMVAAYAQQGHGTEALQTYHRMNLEGIEPNNVTFTSALAACSSIGAAALRHGSQIDTRIQQSGFQSFLIVQNALINMYAKCGHLAKAKQAFDSIPDEQRDLVSWNAMLAAYAQLGEYNEASDFFGQMGIRGIEPNEVTFTSILCSCAKHGSLDQGLEIHAHLKNTRFISAVPIHIALLNMYAKCAHPEKVVDYLPEVRKHRDLVLWNTLLGSYALYGLAVPSIEVFAEMQLAGVQPNNVSFISLLAGCGRACLFKSARNLFRSMLPDFGLKPGLEHYRCMIYLLGRYGRLRSAYHLIKSMEFVPGDEEWTTLLGACRLHGWIDLGRFAGRRALKINPANEAAYVMLANLNAGVRKVQEAMARYRKRMKMYNDRLPANRFVRHTKRKWFLKPRWSWSLKMKNFDKREVRHPRLERLPWRALVKGRRRMQLTLASRRKFRFQRRNPSFRSYLTEDVWTG